MFRCFVEAVNASLPFKFVVHIIYSSIGWQINKNTIVGTVHIWGLCWIEQKTSNSSVGWLSLVANEILACLAKDDARRNTQVLIPPYIYNIPYTIYNIPYI